MALVWENQDDLFATLPLGTEPLGGWEKVDLISHALTGAGLPV